MSEIPPPELIKYLKGYDLLPAIVFVPSRRRCDEAASEVARDRTQILDDRKRVLREKIFEEFALEYPEIKKHKHRDILLRAGVASHHAGHIPSWKFIIERMMSAGLINALFATSTVAAGVDFPARTVVILNADTRGDEGWRPIEASELQQMTGRAGRRGKDKVGFAVAAPGNFQNPPRIAKLLDSSPDPLESKFRSTYSSLLNLLDAFGSFEQVREIAEKSFAFHETSRRVSGLNQSRARAYAKLEAYLTARGGVSIDQVFGFERLMSTKTRIENDLPQRRADFRGIWLRDQVVPGRVVSTGRGGKQFYFVLNVFGDRVSIIRTNGRGKSIDLPQIQRVFSNKYPIDEIGIDTAFEETYDGINKMLREPKLSASSESIDETIATLEKLIAKLISESGKDRESIEETLWSAVIYADQIAKIDRDISNLRAGIWLPFENRALVLQHFGYLDVSSQKVLEEGKWLADLRIDKPLLVGEVLKKGVFEELDPIRIAGIMAAIAADAERDYGEMEASKELQVALDIVEQQYYAVSDIEAAQCVEPTDEINISAASAGELWAAGTEWTELVLMTNAEEGDLVRLLSRTGEALWQIAHLKTAKPEAAENARAAADLVLREPVR